MPRNVISVLWDSDSRQLEGDFNRVEAKSVGVGAAVGTFAGNLAYDLGTRAVGAVKEFADEAVQNYADIEQAVGGTDAVFGDSAGAVEDMAGRSAEALGLSESAFRTATTRIGGQLKRMTGDVDYAADRSVYLTGVAADLAATYGGTTVEAVEALSAAFRREADPAERFNLDLRVSAVNAKAVEMGLADTTSKVDDYAYAQALVALITEQSADAQGQFAREAETVTGQLQRQEAAAIDASAAVGQWIAPFKTELAGIAADLITIGDALANLIPGGEGGGFGELVGFFFDWAPILGDVKRSLESVAMVLSDEEPWSIDKYNAVRDAFGETRDQLHNYVSDAEDAGEATEDLTENTEALEFAEERAAKSALAHRQAILDKRAALQEIHNPLSQMISQLDNLEAAEETVAETERKYGEDSKEYRDAVLARAGIIGDLEQTLIDLKNDGIDPTGAAARTMLHGLGIPHHVIDGIFADFDRLEEDFEGRRFNMVVTTPDLRARSDGTWHQEGTKTWLARGGIARATPGGVDAVIAEGGEDEVVSPLDQLLGMIRHAVADQMSGGPAAGVVNLQVNAARSQPLDGWTIVEQLQRINQTYGPLPIRVEGA